jgi:predicted Zn-dependent protease
MNRNKLLARLLMLLFAACVAYACTTDIVPATGERRYLGFTWQQEAEIGKQASKEVASLFGLYRDPKLEQYVNDVGKRVLATSHLRRPGASEQIRNTPVTFGILDSPIVNAMALPGGYIYVTRGMLANLNSEDQLATVIAHEIGHVAARHAARQAWQQQIGQGLLLGGAILGQGLGLPAQNLLSLGSMAAQLIFLRYSREDELEADKLGVEYASAARYDPAEVIPFFRTLERMQEKEGQGMPSFLATHPNPGDRIQRIRQMLGSSARNGRVADARYLRTVDGIVLGEDPRHGFVEGNVFYHPELRFRFPVPRGFKVVNQPAQVVMVEGQNRAILGFTASGEKSADAAAAKFASQQGLRVLDRSRTRSDGLPASIVIADGQMQNGQVVRVMAYFVEFHGAVYHFLGYSSAQAFNAYRPVFLQTMQGFGEVREARILDRQPVRLELLSVSRPGRFRDLIPRTLPAPFTVEEVAILNQVEPNDEIDSGRTLKVPRAGR